MNPKLHKYGIADEQSDIRAHATFSGQRITVYRTADMVRLVEERDYEERDAYQPGVKGKTATGYLVPIDDIQPQYVLKSELFPWAKYDHSTTDTAVLGNLAVLVVRMAIKANKFPLWVCGIVESDKDIDISGTDITVNATRRIQVKYDGKSYPKSEGGSGNLYVQTTERNPLKIYGQESK